MYAYYVIVVFIIVAILLSFKRIVTGLIAVAFFLTFLFVSIYILDNGTDINIREYIPLGVYDEIINDPEDKAKEVGKDFKESGEDLNKDIKEKGEDLDIKYGLDDDGEESKEWEDVDKEDSSESENKEESSDEDKNNNSEENNDKDESSKEDKNKDGVEEGEESVDKNQSEKNKSMYEKGGNKETKKEGSKKQDSNETVFIEYDEVENVLEGDLKNLNEDDKDLIRTLSNVYKTELDGDDIKVWNDEDKSNEGLYVEYK